MLIYGSSCTTLHSMLTLQRLPASRVLMVAADRLLPHVHVKRNDGRECTVHIDMLEIKGRIAARENRDELAWIAANRALLHGEWRRYNP